MFNPNRDSVAPRFSPGPADRTQDSDYSSAQRGGLKIVTLPYPQNRKEIADFVRRHHYSKRCPGVWKISYAIRNPKSQKIQAVLVYGPAPYPSMARSLVRGVEEYAGRVIWQARMVGAGIRAGELDELIAYANLDLKERGFWWVYTLTDPHARTVDGVVAKIIQKGYSGEVYHRNGFLYLGGTDSRRRPVEGYIINHRQFVHVRQGAVTLTQSNVQSHYPTAKSIRCVRALPKQRWVYVLANSAKEREQRILLLRYHPQPFEAMVQPRMFRVIEALSPIRFGSVRTV